MSERVFVRDPTARKHLANYAGLINGRYGTCEGIREDQFSEMCESLSALPSLQALVKESGRKCPAEYRKLLGELSHGSPTCGVLQVAGNHECLISLKSYAQDDNKTILKNPEILQRCCPVLCECLVSPDTKHSFLQPLVADLLESLEAPFLRPIPRAG